MPSLPNIFTSLSCCLVAVANAAPLVPRAPATSQDDYARLAPSALYNIYPTAPDLTKDSLGFHIETWNNASQVEQVLVFDGIPSYAQDCTLGWQQGDRLERVFIAKTSDALAGVRQLTGLPENSIITHNSIKPFDTATKDIGAADFTNWDDLPAQGHIIGGFDCAKTLYFKVALRNPDGNTKVFLEQAKDNGLYIQYTCGK